MIVRLVLFHVCTYLQKYVPKYKPRSLRPAPFVSIHPLVNTSPPWISTYSIIDLYKYLIPTCIYAHLFWHLGKERKWYGRDGMQLLEAAYLNYLFSFIRLPLRDSVWLKAAVLTLGIFDYCLLHSLGVLLPYSRLALDRCVSPTQRDAGSAGSRSQSYISQSQ